MKKYFLLLLFSLMLLFSVTMAACLKPEENSTANILDYDHSSDLVYSGFSDIPGSYSVEDAINDGCLVIESKSTSSTSYNVSGNEQWQIFIDKSSQNKAAFLRVAHFIGSDYCAFSDLYYSDGKYYLYTKDENGIHTTAPFTYLRKLEGIDGIPPRESCFYVLTDSLELTFEDVRHAFFASDLRTITKIPYEWLGFTVYLETASQ